jgi:uncharacterized protein YjbI with pentapeptide repeats
MPALNGVCLTKTDLSGAWLNGTKLRGADLSRSILRKAHGRGCDAQDAILYGADLERSEFENADLRRADLREVRFGRATFTGADLRGADLRQCTFGHHDYATDFTEARLAGTVVEDSSGNVSGPINVGMNSPYLLDGADLQRWFTDHGAPLVKVWQPSQP